MPSLTASIRGAAAMGSLRAASPRLTASESPRNAMRSAGGRVVGGNVGAGRDVVVGSDAPAGALKGGGEVDVVVVETGAASRSERWSAVTTSATAPHAITTT